MLNIIVATYCIVDDLLKAIDRQEDCRRIMSDAEVITTALVAARFFGGNQAQACQYLLDSFPVAVCDNIRIPHCRLLQGEEYRGYIASKKRYFYGIRIHLVSTPQGVPVEWIFLPAAANDTRGLVTLPLNLPPKSELYTDKGYTDYLTEDNLHNESSIDLMTIRKKNSTRPDSLCLAYVKKKTFSASPN